MPYDFVLVDWACEKVRCDGDFSAAQLCCLVREKLANHAVSYAQIAWSAFQAGRSELACLLLQYEPRVSDRLPAVPADGRVRAGGEGGGRERRRGHDDVCGGAAVFEVGVGGGGER